jgi:hypothetical protein
MKRAIQFKILLFTVLILTSIIFFSCDDSGIVTVEKTPFRIEAKIINYTPFGQNIVFANILSVTGAIYYVCYCPINNESKFTIEPPESMRDTTVMPVESIFFAGCSGGNASFSPSDAKGTPICHFDVRYQNNIIGNVDNNNYSKDDSLRKAGDFEITYIYMNQKVACSGFRLSGSDTVKIDCSLEAGWNKVVRHYTRVELTDKTILYDLTEPSGAQWEYKAK